MAETITRYPCGCTRGSRPQYCTTAIRLWEAVRRAWVFAQREGTWCAYDAAYDAACAHTETQKPIRVQFPTQEAVPA